MRKIIVATAILFHAMTGSAQEIPVIKFGQLKEIIESKEKEILVVNFWATWCGPCVKELPMFDSLHVQRPEVKVTLVSLDFADKIDRVRAFVLRKRMSVPSVLLDEIDYNSWIDKVDPSWEGALPATLIVNTKTGKRKFIAKELEEGQLNELINQLLKG